MNLIPGMEDKNLEIYVFEGKPKAIYNGKVICFWELPTEIIEKFRTLLAKNTAAINGFIDAGWDRLPNAADKMLTQFVCCNFGGFNTEPDMEEGGIFNKEYWDCGRSKNCPFNSHICGGLKTENGNISKREIQIIKLICEGMLSKEIAHILGISVNTVHNTIANIFAKTKVQNRVELSIWARKMNVV